jgi:hypothetical protein
MKLPALAFLVLLLTATAGRAQTKATVSKASKSFDLTADIKNDYRIFGYSLPDVKSKKLILFSIFTNEVEANPYKCPLGAYYQTSDLARGSSVTFVAETAGFVKLNYTSATGATTPFYIQRKFIAFE